MLLAWIACAPPGPPVVLLVSVDTLRFDHVTPVRAPNLARFASEAVTYTRAYSQANETAPSHASLLTGLYASEIARLDADFALPEGPGTLPEAFRASGWATGAFTAGGHLRAELGFHRGFDTFWTSPDWGSLAHTVPRALAWLDAHADQPAFLLVHGYDCHERYLKPPPWGFLEGSPGEHTPGARAVREAGGTARVVGGRLLSDPDAVEDTFQRSARVEASFSADGTPLDAGDEARIRAAYAGAVAWADAWFGLLMAGLDERGVLDRAWIAVFSDHGEQLGERGWFDHRYGLAEEEVHVPLMLRAPDGEGGGRTEGAIVELRALGATLLEVSGVGAGAAGGLGRGDGQAYSEGGLGMAALRTPRGTLGWRGLAPDNPWAAEVVEAASPAGFSGDGGGEVRAGLIARIRGLAPRPSGRRADPAALEALRGKGYWAAP